MTRAQLLKVYFASVGVIGLAAISVYILSIPQETRRNKIEAMFKKHYAMTQTSHFKEMSMPEQHHLHKAYIRQLDSL